eukprot:TRINITY_DN3016_c0_g1_i1.p1 TRINITY_DN3016_c0_g1~~TRINITY_DN3016_c0_g1_i1.p1  ORF type:complete len:107 (-),score=14.25 TRINITY_DN3016_c0_g1_i1:101-421(-)
MGGDIYGNPGLLWPGSADKVNLVPFYDAIVPSIYGNDSDRVVFFESVTWTDEFNARWTSSGFSESLEVRNMQIDLCFHSIFINLQWDQMEEVKIRILKVAQRMRYR